MSSITADWVILAMNILRTSFPYTVCLKIIFMNDLNYKITVYLNIYKIIKF